MFPEAIAFSPLSRCLSRCVSRCPLPTQTRGGRVHYIHAAAKASNKHEQSYLTLTTQARKQTLPPSDSDIHQRVFDCKYLSCKICFNVLNCVFILFIFNLYLYCLVNIQQHCHNSSHCDGRHHILQQGCHEVTQQRCAMVVPCLTTRNATCLLPGL